MTENVNWSNERRISGPVEVHRFTAGGQAPQRVILGQSEGGLIASLKERRRVPQTRLLLCITDLERLKKYPDRCSLLLFRA